MHLQSTLVLLVVLFVPARSYSCRTNAALGFPVIWNAPTIQCKSHKIHFEGLMAKYGIHQNSNDTFRGDKIALLYDPGLFPALLENTTSKQLRLRNGGLPQSGNLTEHLIQMARNIQQLIPDANFAGLAVIDFESWRPVFRQNFGVLQPYKEYSKKKVKSQYPALDDNAVNDLAESNFEYAGEVFMEKTLILAKRMRPRALWGYYAFPYCFNKQYACPTEVRSENDRTMWLFRNSDAFYPSVYLNSKLTLRRKLSLIEGRVNEAARISCNINPPPPIILYFWYNLQDTRSFLEPEELTEVLRRMKRISNKIDGLIIWGSSSDVNTREKCERLYTYVDKVLGPAVVDNIYS